jgi:hypothetical protein
VLAARGLPADHPGRDAQPRLAPRARCASAPPSATRPWTARCAQPTSRGRAFPPALPWWRCLRRPHHGGRSRGERCGQPGHDPGRRGAVVPVRTRRAPRAGSACIARPAREQACARPGSTSRRATALEEAASAGSRPVCWSASAGEFGGSARPRAVSPRAVEGGGEAGGARQQPPDAAARRVRVRVVPRALPDYPARGRGVATLLVVADVVSRWAGSRRALRSVKLALAEGGRHRCGASRWPAARGPSARRAAAVLRLPDRLVAACSRRWYARRSAGCRASCRSTVRASRSARPSTSSRGSSAPTSCG